MKANDPPTIEIHSKTIRPTPQHRTNLSSRIRRAHSQLSLRCLQLAPQHMETPSSNRRPVGSTAQSRISRRHCVYRTNDRHISGIEQPTPNPWLLLFENLYYSMTSDYSKIRSLAGLCLQYSFVISIVESPGSLSNRFKAIFTPHHDKHRSPKPGEQYCYSLAESIFDKVTRVHGPKNVLEVRRWVGRVDLDKIGTLTREEARYAASGEWGSIEI